MKKKTKIKLVATSVLLAVLSTQAAPYHYWTGAVSTNWHDAGNWDVQNPVGPSAVPTILDVAFINEMPANLPTLSTVQSALVFRVAYASGTAGEVNIVDGADFYSIAYNSRVANAGGTGVANQSGGSMVLHSLTVGNSANSVGTYNMSGGTLRSILSGTVGGVGGTSLGAGIVGTGTFNLSGGTVETIRGVTLSGTTDGASVFNVIGGDGIANIGGVDDAAAGFWYQGGASQLAATIDSDNGFSLGQINLIGGSNETPYVTFRFGTTLDVGFSGADMGDVTNSWDLITWPTNTIVTDDGLVFSPDVDLDIWSFDITNNALRVTYGIGSDEIIITNPPPSGPRTLYWTGNGGDTSATNGPNWDVDTADTPANWGIYELDTAYIGHVSVNTADFVSEATYNGGAAGIDQNSLYIGRDRTGIFNFNDGFLKFLSNNSRKNHYIGWGGASGDGTLNVNGGELWIYATELGNQPGASGTININGGDLVLSGRANSSGDSIGYGTLWVGANGGSGSVNIEGGSLKTLIGVTVGDATGTGTFTVKGAGATQIGIGAYRADFDGFWTQNSGSTLKAVIDDSGLTPIEIIETGQGNTPTEGEADVIFEAGSILDVSWAAGVTKFGIFDVMKFGGTYADNGLALAPGIDTNIWSFAFVDDDGDGTNDTLRVTADGYTQKGTSIAWLHENGLTEADDEVDNDGDSLLTWEEYVAGTSPTNASSVLAITSGEINGGGDVVITWQSVAGKSYSILTNTSLTVGAPGVEDTVAGLEGETSYTGTIGTASAVFFKVGVE